MRVWLLFPVKDNIEKIWLLDDYVYYKKIGKVMKIAMGRKFCNIK